MYKNEIHILNIKYCDRTDIFNDHPFSQLCQTVNHMINEVGFLFNKEEHEAFAYK